MIAEMKKIHCQPIVDVNAPESNNPVTAPMANINMEQK
jgi:hypothetical protein